jgi:hypothetical protein
MYDVKMWVDHAPLAGQAPTPTASSALAIKKKQVLEAQRSSLLFTHKGYRYQDTNFDKSIFK